MGVMGLCNHLSRTKSRRGLDGAVGGVFCLGFRCEVLEAGQKDVPFGVRFQNGSGSKICTQKEALVMETKTQIYPGELILIHTQVGPVVPVYSYFSAVVYKTEAAKQEAHQTEDAATKQASHTTVLLLGRIFRLQLFGFSFYFLLSRKKLNFCWGIWSTPDKGNQAQNGKTGRRCRWLQLGPKVARRPATATKT